MEAWDKYNEPKHGAARLRSLEGTLLAACPASCPWLMNRCKETIHARRCHWLATSAASTAKATAWPTAIKWRGGRRPLVALQREYKVIVIIWQFLFIKKKVSKSCTSGTIQAKGSPLPHIPVVIVKQTGQNVERVTSKVLPGWKWGEGIAAMLTTEWVK